MTKLSSVDVQRLSEGIQSFNQKAVPDLELNEDEISFHVLAKSEEELLGGLRGRCYWDKLHIELLWLSESVRGRGIGRNIIEASEKFALEQGMSKSLFETTSWQAKPFYEKHGYHVIGKLEGRPKGYITYYMAKSLNDL